MRDAMLVVAALVAGCYGGRTTTAPSTPQPIAVVNTEYDEFNAAKPRYYQALIYSTNRGSKGGDLDVWSAEVRWDEHPVASTTPRPYLPEAMSPADERGPLVLHDAILGGDAGRSVLILTSGRDGGSGGLDLYWTLTYAPALTPFTHLNSPANDAYLSLPYGEHRALFASDRGGAGYDLYEITWATADLGSAPTSITRVPELSSAADDTAPYVDPEHDVLVFASNRPGGAGGYDLYCATRRGGRWSAPVPLPFNTASDEFRPSVFTIAKARFLLFSSNRPGGAGGYDLYTVAFSGCAR